MEPPGVCRLNGWPFVLGERIMISKLGPRHHRSHFGYTASTRSHLCNRPPGKFLDWLELRGPKVRCPMPCSRLPPAVAAWRK